MEPAETQVIPQAQALGVLSYLVGSTGPFYHPTLLAYMNNVALGPATPLSALTQCTFGGYAAVASVPWLAPYYDIDGTALCWSTQTQWTCNSSATPNAVYGYAMCDVTVTYLWAAWAFATPIGITLDHQAVVVAPALRYSGQ